MLRAGGGAVQEDFQQQTLRVWAVLAAIVLTGVCVAAVLGLQFSLSLAGAGWTILSVREVLESIAQPDQQYVTASIEQPMGINAASVLEWVLDLPAILLLASALGLLVVYYGYIRSVEKTLSRA
jgi:hypothetical protein